MSGKAKAIFNYPKAIEDWESGKSYAEIGKEIGYSEATVKKYIKLYSKDFQESYSKHQYNRNAQDKYNPNQDKLF